MKKKPFRIFASKPIPGPPCVECRCQNMILKRTHWHCPQCKASYAHDPGI